MAQGEADRAGAVQVQIRATETQGHQYNAVQSGYHAVSVVLRVHTVPVGSLLLLARFSSSNLYHQRNSTSLQLLL